MNMPSRPLDVAIVGAGIAGAIILHPARRAGLDAMVFEKGPGVGGLWRSLPAWQDIQISPADWALAGVPIEGALQAQVLANIEAWVRCWLTASGWTQRSSGQARSTADGFCKRLVARCMRGIWWPPPARTTSPVVPRVVRQASVVQEWHSRTRATRRCCATATLVVGGGASAFDLLDQCLEQGARHISWVHRGLKWFLPTTKPKHIAGSVRAFARLQASGLDAAQQSAKIDADMRARYAKFGIEAILPAQPFDVLKDQLIPGRPRMLACFDALQRLRGSVASIHGRTITLTGGESITADVLLWGTGYSMDLGWLEVPALAALRTTDALVAHCGCIFRSLDAGNLNLPQSGLDGIGAAPWANALMARSIMSHIRGTARLDLAPVGHKVNHFDIVAHLAPRDPGSFAPDSWQAQYRAIALDTPDEQAYPMP
jgi:hypothetical protein